MKNIYVVMDEKEVFVREFTNKAQAIKHARSLKQINSETHFIVLRVIRNPWIGNLGELIFSTDFSRMTKKK